MSTYFSFVRRRIRVLRTWYDGKLSRKSPSHPTTNTNSSYPIKPDDCPPNNRIMSTDNPTNPLGIIHISFGGPEFDIQVDGRCYHFEWHSYCGPIRLTRAGNQHSSQPRAFLEAAGLWAQQGKRVEDGLCRWDREPKEIRKHLGGRHWEIVGYEPAVKGE